MRCVTLVQHLCTHEVLGLVPAPAEEGTNEGWMDGWIKQPRQEYNLHSFQELLLPLLLVLEIKLGPSGYGATSSSEPLSSHRHTTHTQGG